MKKLFAIFILFGVVVAQSPVYALEVLFCPMMPAGMHQGTGDCASHETCCETDSKNEENVLWDSSTASVLKESLATDPSISTLPEKGHSKISAAFSNSPPSSKKKKLYQLYSDYRI